MFNVLSTMNLIYAEKRIRTSEGTKPAAFKEPQVFWNSYRYSLEAAPFGRSGISARMGNYVPPDKSPSP